MPSTLITKYGSGAPLASDLVRGELAVDTENGRLYTEDSLGAVVEIGLNPGGNLDVTGTVTADGLTVDSSSGITVNGPTDQDGKLNLVAYAGVQNAEARIQAVRGNTSGTDSRLQFLTNNGTSLLTRVDINDNGNISFYEDTGTTAKFFWDASAESLGLGTASPSFDLDVRGSDATIQARATNASGTATLNLYGIDSTGSNLAVTQIKGVAEGATPASALTFSTRNSVGTTSEAMRIDSSGNLLVGSTSFNKDVNGVYSGNDGLFYATATPGASGDFVSSFNRKTTDGGIIRLQKDGVGVGSIAAAFSDLAVGNSDTGLHFNSGSDQVNPWNMSTNTARDAGINLGASGARFKDLYLSNAVKFGSQEALGTDGTSTYLKANTNIYFQPANTQKMVLDSSGNLLVGQTIGTIWNQSSVTGFTTGGSGSVQATTSAGTTLFLNRLSSDGQIIGFYRDGAGVGSIGATGGDLFIGTGDVGLWFQDGGNAIRPFRVDTQAGLDNSINLGVATTGRFADAYITNGVTTGSDANDKQDIETLSDAEQRVAVACKGLLRKWRWKDAVDAKGDEARIHFGIIAQDLKAAFEAEGLDAGRYAMFMSNTWTDEETGEERTRLGVRYHELLAFIIAAI